MARSTDTRDAEVATRATLEDIPFPKPLTPAEATPGTVVTMLFDDGGKLYRIEGPRPGCKIPSVNVTTQDGKKVYCRIGDLQKSDREFPKLPDFIPTIGSFVTAVRIRGVQPTEPWLVTKIVAGGKATLMRLDGSGAHANIPFAALTPAEVSVTVKS